MNSLTRRRALEAAAKVAISFSGLGCGATGLDVMSMGDPYADAAPESVHLGSGGAAQGSGGPSHEAGPGPRDVTAPTADASADTSDAVADELDADVDADASPDDGPTLRDGAPEARTLACNAPPIPSTLPDPWEAGSPEASVPAETLSCCQKLVSDRLPDGGYPLLSEADQGDPDVQACCLAMVSSTSRPWADDATWSCCQISVIIRAEPACTPWGPPVPPAMPTAWSDDWEVA